MKKFYFGLILLVSLLLSSCEMLFTCLEGNGDMQTEERLGGSFTGVESDAEFNVRIEYAPTTSVEVTSDENLLDYIETTISNGKLYIRSNHDGCLEYSAATQVVVKSPRLTNVTLGGSGNIDVSNFSSEYFAATHAGSGDIILRDLSVSGDIDVNLVGSGNVWLKGRASKSVFELSGSGNIDGEALRVYQCSVNLSGSGNIHTYVYDELKVTLTGSGYVYYYGNTKDVVIRNTGSGDVINSSF